MNDSDLGRVLSPDFGGWATAKSLPNPQRDRPDGRGLIYPPMPNPSGDAKGRKSKTIYADVSDFPGILDEFEEVRHRCRLKNQKAALVWLIHFAFVNELSQERETKEG